MSPVIVFLQTLFIMVQSASIHFLRCQFGILEFAGKAIILMTCSKAWILFARHIYLHVAVAFCDRKIHLIVVYHTGASYTTENRPDLMNYP